MKKERFVFIVFILSLISLIISIKIFWNNAIFVDEYNLSAKVINGGDFWLSMDWLRLLLLFILCVISFANIVKREK